MADGKKMQASGHALARVLPALAQQFRHLAGIAIHQVRCDEGSRTRQAVPAINQELNLAGPFSWRAASDEWRASGQVFRILELDSEGPLTLADLAFRIHPDDRQPFRGIIERARSAAGDFETQFRLQLPDGPMRFVQLVAHEIRDPEGDLTYIGVLQDVTGRILCEQALGQARAQLIHMARLTTLGILAASIVHEITQPLVGMMTNAGTCLRFLDKQPPQLDGARETARRAVRDAERACGLLTRWRALCSRKEARFEALDINETVREAVALSNGDLHRNRVALVVQLDAELRPVRGDRVQLQQVLLNLILNASEAMSAISDRPRDLLIKTEQLAGEQLCVAVRDTGVGVVAQEAERLFEAFYTTKVNGLGIGLSICRTIIEGHRGRLWVQPNPDHGATFLLTLPCGVR